MQIARRQVVCLNKVHISCLTSRQADAGGPGFLAQSAPHVASLRTIRPPQISIRSSLIDQRLPLVSITVELPIFAQLCIWYAQLALVIFRIFTMKRGERRFVDIKYYVYANIYYQFEKEFHWTIYLAKITISRIDIKLISASHSISNQIWDTNLGVIMASLILINIRPGLLTSVTSNSMN